MQQILLQTCIVCCGTIQKSSKDNLLYAQKKDDNCVNIFHKRNYRITTYISTLYKTYCFAFQKRRFCTVKAAVLHRKTYAFATSKRNCHFLTKLSLQNKGEFRCLSLARKRKANAQIPTHERRIHAMPTHRKRLEFEDIEKG